MSKLVGDVLLILVALRAAMELWRSQLLPDNGIALLIVVALAVFVGLRSPAIDEFVRTGLAIVTLAVWWAALAATNPNLVGPMALLAAGLVVIYLLTPVIKLAFLVVVALLVGVVVAYVSGVLPGFAQ